MIDYHPNPEIWNLLQDGVIRGLRTSDHNSTMIVEVATFLSEWLLGCEESVRLTLHSAEVSDFEMWDSEAGDFWEWISRGPQIVSAEADDETKAVHIGFDRGIVWLRYSDLELSTDRGFPLDIEDLRSVSQRFWHTTTPRHVS